MGLIGRIARIREVSLDSIGAAASVMCAVHCAAVALLLGLTPMLEFFAQPWVDWTFLFASLSVGMLALIPGFRQHRQPMPLMLFTGGITTLFMARLLHLPPSTLELSFVLLAAAALVAAHWGNRRELRACRCNTATIRAMLPASFSASARG